ncbi:hypothetical protein GCM10010232_66380 [Streptomyces amakusaensis]|uniref:Uncharacterized protein n=1 Tax=Streptomyces amakusaensis TaxID=67271 RepID=A0ABW0AUR4_9ACTN
MFTTWLAEYGIPVLVVRSFASQTEIGHRLADGYVQRADLVVRAPDAGVPVILLEIDRRSEDAQDLVVKLYWYWEWGRLLPKDADKRTVDLVRSRPDAIEHVDSGCLPGGASGNPLTRGPAAQHRPHRDTAPSPGTPGRSAPPRPHRS